MQKERGPVMSWELRWEAERGFIGVGGLAGSKTTVGDTVPCFGDDAMFFRFALYYYLDPSPFNLFLLNCFFFHYYVSTSISSPLSLLRLFSIGGLYF